MSRKKDNTTVPVKNQKSSPLKAVGRFMRRVFGKARWFLLAQVLAALILFIIGEIDTGGVNITSVTPKLTEDIFPLSEISSASVNHGGTAMVRFSRNDYELAALVDIAAGEQKYCRFNRLYYGEEVYSTTKYVCGNDGKMYFVITDFADTVSTKVLRERIVRVDDEFNVEREYCTVNYDENEKLQASKLSRMGCTEGKISFAVMERDETLLYSIDTETDSLTISAPYPTDPDGTFTFDVIPVSDSFLFMRSDGNVYRTRFGEPLGESIYHFEEHPENNKGFIKFAAVVGDKLYVNRQEDKDEICLLENGTLTEVLNVRTLAGSEDSHKIVSLGGCRPEGSDTELLVVTLDNGIVTFDGSGTSEVNVTISIKNPFLWHVTNFFELIIPFCAVCLVINLIIRKKTLLYKQIAMTLPVLLIPALAIVVSLYFDLEEENTANTEKELDLVCQMGVSALDGYDFTGLDYVGEDTGGAARRLQNKLNSFDHDKTKYIFSVVKRIDEENAAVLARTDRNIMPLYLTEAIVSQKEILENTGGSGNYRFKDIEGFMSDDATFSEIYVLGRLNTPQGEYYLKVKTNSWNLWTTRRDIFLKMTVYILVIIGALTLVTVVSSMYITRTIKKATKAVEQISGGDLSARVSYRSKDELGEICSQVNGMAQSLEALFAEKDKTERFYYKFVPEKFRELLGKDSFTDLELGDASSRELTVLFFDIRAFSINSEIMTAKENFEFVNVIYGKAGPIVRSHGGFIDKYIGDAVMALFENADDAVKCGIELYRAIVLDRSTAEAIHISDLNIGIGIHSGMARIGIVGESERLSGTVISDTVNLSSRLETLTKQYKTAMLISKDTVDRMSDPDSLGLRYLGIVQVAGVNEVKAVYEVLDCLPDEEKDRRSENSLDLREAIRLFHLGRRTEAVKILKKLSDSGANDHVTDMYLKYISGMSEKDKGNVFRFVKK
ncbi:MAG: HAMP domain-containing protein [Ruminococcus sp.]|nr:HAMP domain-containing protein [Ruminococcus sp.]